MLCVRYGSDRFELGDKLGFGREEGGKTTNLKDSSGK